MLIYWLLVLIPLLLSQGEQPQMGRKQTASNYRVALLLLSGVLFLIMSFRESCGDFTTYQEMYEIFKRETLAFNLQKTEPIYGFFNWISARLEWGIYGVNTFCAIVFLACLYRCASREPLPFFFTAISIPYFVIVVGMGYTRQGVAAGLLMLSIQSLRFGRPWHFATQVLLATGFHASALAFLPAILFAKLTYRNQSTKTLIRLLILVLGVIGFSRVFREQYVTYVDHYVTYKGYSSGGAFLRSIVTTAAACIFYWRYRDWRRVFGDNASLQFFAMLSLAMVPLTFVASTPADRVGLYLLPFQLIVFGRLPCLTANPSIFSQLKLGIALCYVVYFYVWMHLGTYSQDLWVPYKSLLW